MNELLAIEAWITAQLIGDSALTGLVTSINNDIAPQGAVPPYVIFSKSTGRDMLGAGAFRYAERADYAVTVVCLRDSFSVQGKAAARIDAVLHQRSGVVAADDANGVPGATVLGCYRTAPVKYTLTDNGVEYHVLGGLYRIYCTA